ncbi:hypothetical protein [Subtercola lobariae]|uniref:Uncharacterized protein n=1 Tax=Subtercola lobariae TaxID=1588641 RepID=A0A917BA07_9MICO|nr:hypothetical protein [Subtercola lobariae]GGF33676.1 hypothetical protein GCM10011399_28540 [Subtercola lobariae]
MPYGPFETLAETRAAALYERLRGSDALVLACAEAGVRLGRFDKRVVEELGQLESETVWVLASIIRRAGAVGS